MNLGRAVSYFSDTVISGWNGNDWDADIMHVTQLPHDQFISEREFGNKRRYILTDPTNNALQTYRTIKFNTTGEVFLVGTNNYDIREDPYSRIYLLHRAPHFGDLVDFTETLSASGMKGGVNRTVIGQHHCDVERITFSRSKEFDGTRFSEVSILFPETVAVDTGHEAVIDGQYYDIQEAYEAAGFKYCRALSKRSS